MVQLLSLAFFQSCVNTWGAGTFEADTLCTADFATINTAAESQVANPFGNLTAAQVRAAIGATPQSDWVHELDAKLPDPVEFDPTTGISTYNHLLDQYISEASSYEDTSSR